MSSCLQVGSLIKSCPASSERIPRIQARSSTELYHRQTDRRMPHIECIPCGHRAFSNKEALQQHLKTSSAPHPVCIKCDKRFSSESGLEAHTATKHPPTFDCETCERSYKQIFALEDHYRGSPRHPNCPRCGKGFRDEQEMEQHRKTAHTKIACGPCGGELIYEDQDSLERHYAASKNHPSCAQCPKGFLDDDLLQEHVSSEHTETTEPGNDPDPSSLAPSPPCHPIPHSSTSPNSPDKEATTPIHTAVVQPALTTLRNQGFAKHDASSTSLYHTGFSPIAPPQKHQFQDLVALGSRRIDSPEIRLPAAFASPLMAVQAPPFSPSGLLPPGRIVNELWNSKQNIQVSPPAIRSSQLTSTPSGSPEQIRVKFAPGFEEKSPKSVSSSPEHRRISSTLSSYSPPKDSPGHSHTSSIHSLESSAFPSPLVPTQSHHTAPNLTRFGYRHSYSLSATSLPLNTHAPTFVSRRAASPARSAASTVVEQTYRPRFSSPPRATTRSNATEDDRNLLPRRLSPPFDFNSRLYPGSARQALRIATNGSAATQRAPLTDARTWGRQINDSEPIPIHWQSLMSDNESDADSIEDSVDSLTPKVIDSPKKGTDPLPEFASSESELDFSSPGSSISISSPESLAKQRSALDDSLMTSESSFDISRSPDWVIDTPGPLDASLQAPEIKFMMSESESVTGSPDVASPIGLQKLPSISPLFDAHSALASFDIIPEARLPLPDSLPPSPESISVQIADDDMKKNLNCSPQDQLSSLSSPGNESYVTSPQELAQDQGALISPDTTFDGDADKLQVPPTPSSLLHPLHCRECKAETCEDITATMCGHVFCNRCIVNAVIKTSRCPLCSTPTLLYCLFRLDLETS
ncbi:hypothetical protein FA15DRAFT_43299 [Coprinopsis marcescibilis]|uniref:RING-type domain-containing protein n=1 Tax=Coprinopsis marcescibilis TaxID=230819 RepID=A0A5C3L6B2_COPMA|nr:hypothetical protein FA15DRAFT_43299 [Coprinopsis marcescibilis]